MIQSLSSMKKITYGKTTQSIADWIKEGKVTANTVYKRLKAGHDIMYAINSPMRKQKRSKGHKPSSTVFAMFHGQRRSANDIAEITGWSGNTIRRLIRAGKPITMKPAHLPVNKGTRPAIIARDVSEDESPEEYILKNMQMSMSDEEIRQHLERGMI